MNDKHNHGQETVRTFRLMTEIESGETVSAAGTGQPSRHRGRPGQLLSEEFCGQRVHPGQKLPAQPLFLPADAQGLCGKDRLAYQHLAYFNNLYTVVRQDYRQLFCELCEQSVGPVYFCGVDEVAEIAYLSMQELGLELAGVLDEALAGGDFFGNTIKHIEHLPGDDVSPIVITSIKKEATLVAALLAAAFTGADYHHREQVELIMAAQKLVIEAGRTERHYWRDLWRYRELFYFLVWRDILVRYKQTVLGIAWAVLRPFLTMVVFTVVFGRLAKLPADGDVPYAIMVYAAMLPWQFFRTRLPKPATAWSATPT